MSALRSLAKRANGKSSEARVDVSRAAQRARDRLQHVVHHDPTAAARVDVVLEPDLRRHRRAAASNAIKQFAETATLVYVPCHRSHVDYLVLSYLLYSQGLMIPHVAAGDNLDMPSIGPLLRRGGAFFMRRSFRDDRLYCGRLLRVPVSTVPTRFAVGVLHRRRPFAHRPAAAAAHRPAEHDDRDARARRTAIRSCSYR